MASHRVGLIGAGDNTRVRHIPGLRSCEDVDIVSVVNRSEASSRRVAEEFGIPKVAPSVEALLADSAVDAVCIGTWPYMHRDYTIAALEAGKHVLCEARMSTDAATAEEMLACARRHPSLVAQLVPAPFDFRLGPTITRLVREGALGDLVEVTCHVLNGSGLDPATPLHWRQRGDYSGKNVMMLGIYNEMLQRWLGDTRRVVASGSITVQSRSDPETGEPRDIDIPDSYRVLAELASGVPVSYHLSSLAAGAPWNGVVVYGSRATLRWTANDRAQLQPHGGEATEVTPDPGTDRGWRVEADFVDSVRKGTPVRLTSFEDGVRYMRFIDACWESWKSGRAMELSSTL